MDAFVAGRLDQFSTSDGSRYRRLRLADGDRCERTMSDGAAHSVPFTAEFGAHLVALAQANSMEELDQAMKQFTGLKWSDIENPPKSN